MPFTRKKQNSRILLAILVFSLLLALLPTQPTQAFKPDYNGHLGITFKVLSTIERVVDGETLTFSDRAIKQILDANLATDFPFGFLSKNHFDDELFDYNTNRLLKLKKSIIAKITAASPNGASARKDLGGALHTLQDFYAHTNWVELGHTDIDTRLGRSTYQGEPLTVATCPDNPNILGGAGHIVLTSGYFKIAGPPPGKCRHGGSSSGLNKDEPARPYYTEARILAVEASKDFMNQILDDAAVAGNAKAIKALMDVKSTLGMIIDDTGSMSDVIGQVNTQVTQIVTSVRGTVREPAQYLLVRFGDPDVGPPFVTADANAFLSAVGALLIHGGGDCPELSMTAALQAVGSSQEGSRLYLFTDADAKDGDLASSVVAAARAKRIKISPLLFGSCSSIDPAYIKIAEETGGQLFVLNSSEVSQIFNLIKPQLPDNLAPIVSLRGSLAGDTREFTVPVDSSVESVTFSVSIDSKQSISVLRPSGTAVVPGETGVSISDLGSGQIVTVDAPESGTWRLQVAGSGAFSIAALANSSLQFTSFQFVDLTGRAEHEGLFPIAGQPVAGASQTGLASLLGPFATANFELIDEAGQPIQPIDLQSGNPDAAADDLVGTFELPAQSFRVAVSGLDSNGKQYQRIFSTLFRSQTVQLTVDDDSVVQLVAGETKRLRFFVQNMGAQADFQMTAVDDHGFVSAVGPIYSTLEPGASSTVEVDLTVPKETSDGTNLQLTVTSAKVDDPAVANSITLDLTVAADPTAPVITPTIVGTQGASGWYTSDVTVSWSTSDPESGIQDSSGCETTTLTAETLGTTLLCSATNGIGHSNRTEVTFWIDKTGPAAALLATSGAPSRGGWYTGDVIISTIGSESVAAPVACTTDQFQTAETAGTIFNGTCTNDAGLATHAVPLTIKLDRTAPMLAITNPQARKYANTAAIQVIWTTSDALSGVASSSGTLDGRAVTNGQLIDLSDLKLGPHTIVVSVSDKAGNTASTSVTFTTVAGIDPKKYYIPLILNNP